MNTNKHTTNKCVSIALSTHVSFATLRKLCNNLEGHVFRIFVHWHSPTDARQRLLRGVRSVFGRTSRNWTSKPGGVFAGHGAGPTSTRDSDVRVPAQSHWSTFSPDALPQGFGTQNGQSHKSTRSKQGHKGGSQQNVLFSRAPADSCTEFLILLELY